MALDPFYAAQLKLMAEAGGPALNEMSPTEGRAMYRVMQEALPRPDVSRVDDLEVSGPHGAIPIRRYSTSLEPGQPCLLYFHGGGWVIGDLETHDSVCRQIAIAAGCTVIATDYRLAPEYPFPIPLDDCYAVACWVHDNAASLGVDADRLAAGGDSAGGNLTASLCLRIRDAGGPALAAQILVYPVTDTRMDTASYADNGDGYLLTRESMEWFWNHYLQDQDEHANPLVSPLRAADLSGLPAATVLTAEYDPLRDEGEAYAERLRTAGVPTVMKRYDGMIHGFFGADGVDGAREAMALVASQLRSAFG